MTRNELLRVADFLEEYRDRLGNDGCNDWDYPSDWTEEDRETFCREYSEWNGEEETDCTFIPNFCAVGLLASKIKRLAEERL